MKNSIRSLSQNKSKLYYSLILLLLIISTMSGCNSKKEVESLAAVEQKCVQLSITPTPEVTSLPIENLAAASLEDASIPNPTTPDILSSTNTEDPIPNTNNIPTQTEGDSTREKDSSTLPASIITSENTLPEITASSIDTTVGNPVTSQVTLLAVGDNLIHSEVVKSGKKKNGTYNYDHLYSNLKEEISAADIAIINQETILGGSDFAYSGYPSFNSPTEIGDAVINAGFDVVLHATNHTMDKGLKGVKNTLTYWAQHPEITVLGINETLKKSKQIPIIEKNGIKIAMLNYTYGLNGYTVPKDKPYLVNMLDKKKMAKDIKSAEALADFTIVFPHWGTEYVYEATTAQENLTEFFYEQGVDLVIGTHPHVLEPVEWIETKANHRMLVYYSLGNFMSYQREAPRMLGGIATITITKDSSGTFISDAGITPIITHFENGPADYNYAIYKLTDYSAKLAKAHGVSDHATKGDLTYPEIHDLAEQVLGSWFE